MATFEELLLFILDLFKECESFKLTLLLSLLSFGFLDCTFSL